MMEVTKVDLKILIKEFLTASNRVLRAGYEVYATELSKFVRFLENHELIYDYIKSCGEPEYDIAEEVEEVCRSYGRCIFSLGSTDKGEVANIYAVIKYLADNNYEGRSFVYDGYSSSKKFQEKVNGFGDSFIRVLITHIENYLARISIQMGLDEKTTVNVNIENSTLSNAQVNVASDGNSIVANQSICDTEQLQKLLDKLLSETSGMDEDDKQTVNDCAETIATIVEEKPKRGIIKMAINTLKGISGTAEFMAAVTAIVSFVQQSL